MARNQLTVTTSKNGFATSVTAWRFDGDYRVKLVQDGQHSIKTEVARITRSTEKKTGWELHISGARFPYKTLEAAVIGASEFWNNLEQAYRQAHVEALELNAAIGDDHLTFHVTFAADGSVVRTLRVPGEFNPFQRTAAPADTFGALCWDHFHSTVPGYQSNTEPCTHPDHVAVDVLGARVAPRTDRTRIDQLEKDDLVTLQLGSDEDTAVFERIDGEGEGRRAVFSSTSSLGAPYSWSAYRYNGRWVFGSSAEPVRLLSVQKPEQAEVVAPVNEHPFEVVSGAQLASRLQTGETLSLANSGVIRGYEVRGVFTVVEVEVRRWSTVSGIPFQAREQVVFHAADDVVLDRA